MTENDAIRSLEEILRRPDHGGEKHYDADCVIIKFIKLQGFDRLADVWEQITPKWYE